jgi:hypothetical protein
MATTPTYGFHYPASTDPPTGWTQIQQGMTDVEAKFVSNDAAITALQNPAVIGGEYQGTSLAITASGTNPVTKLSFGTTIQAAAGITWNGSNQFTVVTAGVYGFHALASMAFVGSSQNWALAVHDGTSYPANAYQAYAGPMFSSGQTNSFTYGEKYLAAGATISCYAYNNENAARTLVGAQFRVWRVRTL